MQMSLTAHKKLIMDFRQSKLMTFTLAWLLTDAGLIKPPSLSIESQLRSSRPALKCLEVTADVCHYPPAKYLIKDGTVREFRKAFPLLPEWQQSGVITKPQGYGNLPLKGLLKDITISTPSKLSRPSNQSVMSAFMTQSARSRLSLKEGTTGNNFDWILRDTQRLDFLKRGVKIILWCLGL